MKIFRFALNVWITLASLLSFLLGWAALAHSPKPVQPAARPPAISSIQALPTLAPLQFGNNDNNSNMPNFQVQIPNNNFSSAPAPIFSTGGS